MDKKWDLMSLSSIPLIMTLGNSMLIPVLPTIKGKLGISSLQVSFIITSYACVSIVLIPIAGYLSDRFGRKKIIIPALIITGLGGLLSGIACWRLEHSYLWILLGRVLQGVGAAGAAPIVLPLVGDMFKSEKEVSLGLGIIETSNTIGKVLSPIFGAILASFLWFLPFLSIPIFCLVSIILVSLLVKSPKKKESAVPFKKFIHEISFVFSEKGRWLYSIFFIGCMCMLVLFGILFYLSSELEDTHHIEGVKKGLILAIPLTALSLSSYFTGRSIGQNKKRMKWITFLGILLLTFSIFITAFSENLFLLLSTLFVGGIGIGMFLPCLDAFITEGIKKQQRGTVTSLYSSMRFVGVSLGPPAVSYLSSFSHQAIFFSLSGLSAIAGLTSLFAIKPRKSNPKENKSVFKAFAGRGKAK